MSRELNERALDAAMRAFWKGPPGVVRRVALNDSTPPDYEPMPATYKDARLAISDAIDAYLESVGLQLVDRAVAPEEETHGSA